MIAHSSSVTGCTERRELLTRIMSLRAGSALIASSVTDLGRGLDGLDVDHAELAGLVRVVGIVFPDHLDDADDRLAVVGMVEEALLALFHGHQVLLGHVVAHAVPEGPLVAGATWASQDQTEGSDL